MTPVFTMLAAVAFGVIVGIGLGLWVGGDPRPSPPGVDEALEFFADALAGWDVSIHRGRDETKTIVVDDLRRASVLLEDGRASDADLHEAIHVVVRAARDPAVEETCVRLLTKAVVEGMG